MLPRVSTRFLFPLFRLNFYCFFFLIKPVFLLVSICNYCCPSYFCLLSPLLLTIRVPLARRSAGKKFSQIWARPALGSDPRHSFWLSESRSIAYRSGRIVALKNTFARLVRVACVGSCMYVHTNIHTYIHICIFLYIDIYSAICFLLVLVQRKRESLSFVLIYIFRKKNFAISKNGKKSPVSCKF